MKKYILISSLVFVGCGAGGEFDGEESAQVAQELTQSQRVSRIDAKRGVETWLGNALAAHEHYNTGNQGARRRYQNGNIYIGDNVGSAWTLYGLIHGKWEAKGGRTGIGFPTTDELNTRNNTGRFNNFENGYSIFWKTGAPQAFEVHGCHRNVWVRLDYDRGVLGFPTSDEFTLTGMMNGASRIVSRFERGNLYFQAQAGGCQYASWPVLTASSYPSPVAGHPQLTWTSFANWSQLASYGHLSVSGQNFTPGETVSIRFNGPLFSNHAFYTTAQANGSFSVSEREVRDYHINRTIIGGWVTVAAVGETSGHVAARRTSVPSYFGSAYTGAY